MTVAATFRLQIGLDSYAEEQQIAEADDALRSALLANDSTYGQICLAWQDQATIIDDDLSALAQNLCFHPIPDLLGGRPVSIPLFRYAGDVQIEPEGDMARVSGELIETAVFPRRELAVALYECGVRFVALLRRLGVEEGQLAETAAYLESQAEPARASLASA